MQPVFTLRKSHGEGILGQSPPAQRSSRQAFTPGIDRCNLSFYRKFTARATSINKAGLAPSWQKCDDLSRFLHFCEGNKGCAFINDGKLIARDAARMVPGLKSKIPTTSSRSHCLATPAASASSILPAAFAFHARTFHEHCSVHSLDGGFSGATTGSILMSRPTSQDSDHSPQGVLRLKWWEQLFGEAGRIMPYDAGILSINLATPWLSDAII